MSFNVITASDNFTRPADTSSYTSGDLVANDTTAASVVPLQFTLALTAGGAFMIRRARIKKSGVTVTAASFRLHLYGADPSSSSGIANGDNAAWSTKEASYLGSIDIDLSGTDGRVFTDASKAIGAVAIGSEIGHKLSGGQIVYGLLEARGSYAPDNAELFTIELEAVQN